MEQNLPEIPSEFIEPYLEKFIVQMIEFAASAHLTEEDKKNRGLGWTVAQVKEWVKGVELFTSFNCGIHARYIMMNEYYQ